MPALKLKETYISTGSAFNPDHFDTEHNHKSKKNGKAVFWLFFPIRDSYFNP